MEREITDLPVENINTEEEIVLDDLNITSDDSDYDILQEEQETISLNNTVWFKTKK